MSDSVCDLNSISGRGMPKSAAQKFPSEAEGPGCKAATNSKLMAEVLQKLPDGLASMEVIIHILAGMERLGLIKKIEMRGG